ncbi:MAG: ribosomal RNA small subunit methyltransferase A [Elusimicrobia bacterium]|nr:ribosomal RNA small subunit methyltransferase A [Elusimicrobiota bacterium]
MRKWGQHFLRSPETSVRIVEAAAIQAGDCVLEIGPGHGELTRHYAGRAAEAFLLEIDPILVQRLSCRWSAQKGRVKIIEGDARKFDFKTLAFSKPPVVLGNLPYYASKPILSKLLDWGGFDRAVIMLQLELCQRLLAQAGSSNYSALSVLFQLRASGGRMAMILEPEAFQPSPKVKSALICFSPNKSAAGFDCLEKILRAAFFSRRKKLINSLAKSLPDFDKKNLAEIISSVGISPEARPQDVSPKSYVELGRRFFGRGVV